MGICSSISHPEFNCNQVKMDGKYKDVTKDYLLEESIKEPLNNKYRLTKTNSNSNMENTSSNIIKATGNGLYKNK